MTIICSIVVGCEYTKDINNKLVCDKGSAKILGMERFPDQSQINILLKRFNNENINELKQTHIEMFNENSLSFSTSERKIIDIDQSGLIANGKTYELAEKGYFPKKRNQKGYKISVSYSGNSKESLSLYLEKGNSDEFDNMENILSDIKKFYINESMENIIVRADAGYGSKKGIELLEKYKVKYITKMYSSTQAKKKAEAVREDEWEDINELVSIHEIEINTDKRYVLVRILTDKGCKYSCLITNINNMTASELFNFYNERQTIEAFFKTCKNTYHIKNLRTRKFNGIYAFLLMVFITHNMMINMKKTYFDNTKIEKMGMSAIYKEMGEIMVDIIEKDNITEVMIPPLNKLVKIVIEKLCYKYKQISIYMLNKDI
jgi:hypothetical protein